MTCSACGHKLEWYDVVPAEMMEMETTRVAQMIARMLEPRRAALRVQDLEAATRVVVAAVEEVVHSIKMFDAPMEEQRLVSALADMIHSFLFGSEQSLRPQSDA